MNTAPFSKPRLIGEDPRAAIVRLLRRACVLREQGDGIAAERLLEGEVAEAVHGFREVHGADALPERELLDLFAAEERRVAEAAIMCELLLPRLLAAISATRPDAVARPVTRPSASGPRLATVTAGAPAISDLLDAMLAAERPGRQAAAPPYEP